MTRRPMFVAVAVVVVVVGLVVRPLLSHRTGGHERPLGTRTPRAAVVDPAVTTVATAAAVTTLACRSVTRHHVGTGKRSASPLPRWCGRYTVTRTQTLCLSVDRCTVQTIGSLAAPAASSVVALTVTLHRVAGRWHVTGVRS